MSLHHELNHLKKCPVDTWQVIRISSSSDDIKIADEAWELQEALNEMLKFTPFKVKTGRVDRKIYVMKLPRS